MLKPPIKTVDDRDFNCKQIRRQVWCLIKPNPCDGEFNTVYLLLRCGNGIRERTREHQLPGRCTTLENFTCRHSKKQEEWCNIGCPNGGTPSQSGCNCRLGYHGNCCQFGTVQLYICKMYNISIPTLQLDSRSLLDD